MKKILLLTILLYALTACEDSINIDEVRNVIPQPGVIKPLNVGNEWIYRTTYYNEDGTMRNESDEKHIISQVQNTDGLDWFVEEIGDAAPKIKITYMNNADGLWVSEGNDYFSIDTPYLLVPYPVKSKDELLISRTADTLNKIYDIYRTSQSVNLQIAVTAGNFRCLKYSDVMKDDKGNYIIEPRNIVYYSPKVGLIKSELYALDSKNKIYLFQMQELIKYTIKN